MAALSTILSAFSLIESTPTISQASVGAPAAPANTPAAPSVPGDRYAAGEWWRNRAMAGGGLESAAGDARQRQAARAYAAQGGMPGQPEVRTAADGLTVSGEGSEDAEEAVEAAGRDTDGDEAAENGAAAAGEQGLGDTGLSQAEKMQVAELRSADTAVRAHERAHLAAAGPYATSGASFQYRQGPDGKDYAVAGEVQIDTSQAPTPEETIAKMTTVRSAALAPANPSPQDRRVAAKASSAIVDARQEQRLIELEEMKRRQAEAAAGEESGPGAAVTAGDETGATSPAAGAQRGYGIAAPAPAVGNAGIDLIV